MRRDAEASEAASLAGMRRGGKARVGARNKAITLMEDSGSDGIRGSRAMRATEKFLVFTELVMLDDRG